MKRRSCDFEGETDKGHDNAGKKKRRERLRSKTFRDGGQASRARHAINEAQPKEGKSTGGTAKEKILQAGFGRSDIGFVECRHKIKRQTGKLESDEDHEQFLATNEKQEADGSEQNDGKILAVVWCLTGREKDGEEGKDQTDDLEERVERRGHKHAVEQIRVCWKHQYAIDRDNESEGCDQSAKGGRSSRTGRGTSRHCRRHSCHRTSATRCHTNHENDERSQGNDRFRRGAVEAVEVRQ